MSSHVNSSYFLCSNWDVIMDTENTQEGEAQRMRNCAPPSDRDAPGKCIDCMVFILKGNFCFLAHILTSHMKINSEDKLLFSELADCT